MVGPIPIHPATVVVGQQPGNVAPVVVHQPAVAPAVAVNNVVQRALTLRKKENIGMGVLIGEGVVNGFCAVGTGGGALGIAVHMGATSAVAIGVGLGTAFSVALCGA